MAPLGGGSGLFVRRHGVVAKIFTMVSIHVASQEFAIAVQSMRDSFRNNCIVLYKGKRLYSRGEFCHCQPFVTQRQHKHFLTWLSMESEISSTVCLQ